MNWARVTGTVVIVLLGGAGAGWAQESRPAMPTAGGDTGLWFVPTAEVLRPKEAAVSVQEVETDYPQGNTNVVSWPITGAIGFGRAEVFGAMHVVTRVDRDTVPLLFAGPDNEAGGLNNEFPLVRTTWTGSQIGDLFLGTKLNLLSQQHQSPLALAVRGTVKVPTGDKESGASSGEYDGFADFVASHEGGGVEFSGFTGFAWRGNPNNVSLSDGMRWGLGAGFGSRHSLRATAELYGEWLFDDTITAPAGALVGGDGSLSPATSRLISPVTSSFGITWQHHSGVLLGAAITYAFRLQTPASAGLPANSSTDAIGLQFRLGFHGGVKAFVPPAPTVTVAIPPPAPAAPPAPPPLIALAAPEPEPAVQEPAPVGTSGETIEFEDVHFDFDQFHLRADALAILAPAVDTLMKHPEVNLRIEGHTCNIGTAEYNLALGERRASAVREYLVQHGIAPSRLTVVSYGEEKPAFDNSQESTRKLNRRAALIVRTFAGTGTSGTDTPAPTGR